MLAEIFGEVSRIELSIDTAKEIFAAQQEIPEHDNIVRILSCEINGNEGSLMLEPTGGRLEALISLLFSSQPNTHVYSFDMRLRWCHQLLLAIRKVHLYRVHGNIDTMNIFYTSSLDRSITVKLGPVADRKCLSRIYHSRNIFYTSLPSSSLALDTGADIAAAGCILSLLLCGHHIYGLESVDQCSNMEHRILFNKSKIKDMSVEACDLIERMVEGSVDTDTCLSHPVFWKARKRLAYISELVRTGKHLRLPSDEKLGLGSDWRSKLKPEGVLVRHLSSSPSSYGCHPSDLLRLCRNFYQHPPTDYQGCDLFDDAILDLQKFRSLFLDLFTIFGPDPLCYS